MMTDAISSDGAAQSEASTTSAALPLVTVTRVYPATETDEFPGATVHRSIGQPDLDSVGPFLLWDAWDSVIEDVERNKALRPHPHRGQETLTYVIEGGIEHRDSKGHKGKIGPLEAQWMTAGRGVIHDERSIEGRTRGFQLWINLKRKDKMVPAKYRNLTNLPVMPLGPNGEDGRLVIVVGESHGAQKWPKDGQMYTRIQYTDVTLNPGGKYYEEIVPIGWHGFVFVVDGTVEVESAAGSTGSTAKKHSAKQNETVVFRATTASDDSSSTCTQQTSCRVRIKGSNKRGCRVFIIAGEPIDEPLVRYGPFVLNSREEVQVTLQDYRLRKNGFEGQVKW